jgi:uncharacterized protein (DUF58 family)
MARDGLSGLALPGEAELQSFARAAAQLLEVRSARHAGARVVRRRPGVGLQHLDHRDYQPGDELRHVDWRQTARHGRPVLRQFEAEASGDWTLLLDASSSMTTHDSGKWRAACRAAAGLAYALLAGGARVRVLGIAERVLGEVGAGRGAAQYAAIARMLQATSPEPDGRRCDLAAAAVRLRGEGASVVLGDLLGAQEMRPALRALRERCSRLHVLRIVDTHDLELLDSAPTELVDVETGERRAIDPATALPAARLADRAAAERLRAFCRESGLVFSEWRITAPWQSALLEHLLAARAS